MLTQVKTVTGPSVKVVLHVHASTNTLLCADRPGNMVSVYIVTGSNVETAYQYWLKVLVPSMEGWL